MWLKSKQKVSNIKKSLIVREEMSSQSTTNFNSILSFMNLYLKKFQQFFLKLNIFLKKLSNQIPTFFEMWLWKKIFCINNNIDVWKMLERSFFVFTILSHFKISVTEGIIFQYWMIKK